MEETCDRAGAFLQAVLEKAGFALEVSTEQAPDRCVLNLDGRDAELLQAAGGELLEALQHLVNQPFGRSLPTGQRIVYHVHGFRATRETDLRAMALHAAAQVRATGPVFTFGSMNAQERTVIHVTLA